MIARIAVPATVPRPAAPTLPHVPASHPELPAAGPDVDPYDPDVVRARVEAGRVAEMSDGIEADFGARPAPGYFRTYEQLKTALYALQEKYPNLVEVRDIGDTAEKLAGTADRDVLALVLTNKAKTEHKPSTLHVGGIHAREIANPELLMTFADQLLTGYGSDAEATMLLDSRETVLVPMLNADGHAVVERGFAGTANGNTMQRKSTMNGDPAKGTDLNRNFEHHWGGPGASPSERNETYRGPSAASEPETQAIQRYVDAHKPDFFIDWHSYSQLNMYPWGDTKDKTKDFAAFDALARKFTTWNGYSPMQSIQLYPTTGTTDDTVYARTGKAAMCIETGTSFHQSDADFQKTLAGNLPILDYVARISDSPFERVFGPEASNVVVDPITHTLQAAISDANNGGQAVAAAELVLDPHAAPGTGVALTPADGSFDAPGEQVTADLAQLGGTASAAAPGTLVYVRGRDAAGNWGPLSPQWLNGPATPAASARAGADALDARATSTIPGHYAG